MCVARPIYMHDMAQSCISHDLLVYVVRLVYLCGIRYPSSIGESHAVCTSRSLRRIIIMICVLSDVPYS